MRGLEPQTPSPNSLLPIPQIILMFDNASVTPLVLRMLMTDGDHLPSGEQNSMCLLLLMT